MTEIWSVSGPIGFIRFRNNRFDVLPVTFDQCADLD